MGILEGDASITPPSELHKIAVMSLFKKKKKRHLCCVASISLDPGDMRLQGRVPVPGEVLEISTEALSVM